MVPGQRVTFMAKPFAAHAGNSCHIHLSLLREDGSNAFASPAEPLGINDVCRSFIAGVLMHIDELSAILLPSANSYRRIVPGLFAPYSRVWGIDNRTAAVRVLTKSPESTRVEIRLCGGDVNLYLAFAGFLAAGLDGIRTKLDPGMPARGDLDGQDLERVSQDWGRALEAFESSDWVKQALGEEFCENYLHVKRSELDKYQKLEDGEVDAFERDRRLHIEFL